MTRVEADAIRAEVASWPAERKRTLMANVAAAAPRVEGPGPAPGPGTDRCTALAPDGLCLIYAARPIVCRSHGAPIRMRDERSLPVVQACHENFAARGPAAADPDCIIDQTTLSAMVLAVDRDAGHDGERIDLAVVLADC